MSSHVQPQCLQFVIIVNYVGLHLQAGWSSPIGSCQRLTDDKKKSQLLTQLRYKVHACARVCDDYKTKIVSYLNYASILTFTPLYSLFSYPYPAHKSRSLNF
jgi:hypothetical protein